MYIAKDKHMDLAEKDDLMQEMESLPMLQVGNAYISLCPICYELTFGFSSDPKERSSGVKNEVTNVRLLMATPKYEVKEKTKQE